MGREFELKYAATPQKLDRLHGNYPNLAPITMETTYYDTPDGAMSNLRWTLRRRLENGTSVCTLKTPAGEARNEWETECARIEDAIEPLIGLGAPAMLRNLAERGLTVSCGAKFLRLAATLELEGCTAELALDRGVLTGGGKELPFAEVEVELKSGSPEAVAAFARRLAAEFELQPENRSKVARARALCSGTERR